MRDLDSLVDQVLRELWDQNGDDVPWLDSDELHQESRAELEASAA